MMQMTGLNRLETVTALRCGPRVVYVCEQGETLALAPDGQRAIVVHPDRGAKFINLDGSQEQLVFNGQ